MCQKLKSEHNTINKLVTRHYTFNSFNKCVLYSIITHLTRLFNIDTITQINTIIYKISLISTCKYVLNELKLDLKY